MDEEMSMTAKEAARLTDWLKAHGHTAEEADDCIKYIVGMQPPNTDDSK